MLVDLATISGTAHGQLVASQLMDVTVRVAPVRPFVVEAMLGLLLDTRLVLGPGRATLHEVGGYWLGCCLFFRKHFLFPLPLSSVSADGVYEHPTILLRVFFSLHQLQPC